MYFSDSIHYEVVVSQSILDEFGYHLRRLNPTLHDSVRQQYVAQVCQSTAEIIEGFPILEIPDYPDEHDLHIHSAAVFASVNSLITDDRMLLKYSKKASLPYETLSSDGFLTLIAHSLPHHIIVKTYTAQTEYYQRMGWQTSVVSQLYKAGVPHFASYLSALFEQ